MPLQNLSHDDLLKSARRLLAEADALSSRIAATNEIGIAISRSLDIDEILRVVTKQSKWLLDFDHCGICLRSHDEWSLRPLFGKADETPFSSDELLETDNIGHVIKSAQSKIIHEGSNSPVLVAYNSQIIIPLTSDKEVLGVIYFASKAPNAYTLDDARIAYMLSLQLSGALRNVQAYELIARKEAELRIYAEKLEETNAELDAFAHTIAHDLKTPISSIIIKADLMKLRYGNSDPELLRQTRQMREAAYKMSEMIGQLLWLARLRDVRETVERVNMSETITDAIQRFSDPIAQARITVTVADDIPDAMGHSQWVEEVFANLISNAIKYMGDANMAPSITITGERIGDEIRYAVTDSGVGIAEADQAKLFEMFTRLHTVHADGLGLGLSIVHRIIKKLGGQLGVESELGTGSTFWFTLPAVQTISILPKK